MAIKVRRTPEERYKAIEEAAWKWYKHNVVGHQHTEVELVLLRGNYEGKFAIKIPIEKDTREFKQKIEEEFNISIRRYIFSCDFSVDHEPRKYKVYLYRYTN